MFNKIIYSSKKKKVVLKKESLPFHSPPPPHVLYFSFFPYLFIYLFIYLFFALLSSYPPPLIVIKCFESHHLRAPLQLSNEKKNQGKYSKQRLPFLPFKVQTFSSILSTKVFGTLLGSKCLKTGRFGLVGAGHFVWARRIYN